MFDTLTDRLTETFKKLRGKGVLTEEDVNDAMRQVRLALLEADVQVGVVKSFIARVKERAIGQEVLESLSAAHNVIRVVQEEMTKLLGGQESRLAISPKPPTIVLLMGLQGAGKTTLAGKLALRLKKESHRPFLIAADVYRPAAMKQLQVLAQQVDVPAYVEEEQTDVTTIVKNGLARAEYLGRDVVIIDTAGRLQIDDALMSELADVAALAKPYEKLLVVDAMTGQEAVRVAQEFQKQIGITGVVLTKLDGDTRGGAALSLREVTGAPIKYVGVGEKLEALDLFYPDRMVSRILGMGDVLTMIEKASSVIDPEKGHELERKIRDNDFNLEDFLEQLRQIKKMGPLGDLLKMIPGFSQMKELRDVQVNEKDMAHIEAIISSMTHRERLQPNIIDGSRRKRIALGSGRSVQEVNRLLKQYQDMRKMMKSMSGMMKKRKGKKSMFGGVPPFMKGGE